MPEKRTPACQHLRQLINEWPEATLIGWRWLAVTSVVTQPEHQASINYTSPTEHQYTTVATR